jgi:hypothetical protein
MSALSDVANERYSQVIEKGYDSKHDDVYRDRELTFAAVGYIFNSLKLSDSVEWWPWDLSHWKPRDARDDLVRAAALLIAEIDRIDREVTSV